MSWVLGCVQGDEFVGIKIDRNGQAEDEIIIRKSSSLARRLDPPNKLTPVGHTLARRGRNRRLIEVSVPAAKGLHAVFFHARSLLCNYEATAILSSFDFNLELRT